MVSSSEIRHPEHIDRVMVQGSLEAASGSRVASQVIRCVFLITPLLAIILPKTLAVVVPVLGGLAILHLWSTQRARALFRPLPGAMMFALAFFTLATVSALWGMDPVQALRRGSVGLLTVIAAYAVFIWCDTNKALAKEAASWAMAGMLAGLSFMAFEIVTDQLISRFVFQELFGRDVRLFLLNLNMTSAALLLWPAIAAAQVVRDASSARLISFALIVAVVGIALGSDHETSKLSLLVALTMFALAKFSRPGATMSLKVLWIAAVTLMVPVCLFAHQYLKLDESALMESEALQSGSVRHRLIIWGNLSARVFDAPILGHGTRAIYRINAEDKAAGRGANVLGVNAVPPHAHNVYLQTWFELGSLGALLFGATGFMLLRGLSGVPPSLFPLSAAAAANGMVQIFPSFEIWQQWYFAALALSCATLIAALKAAR